MNTQDLNTFFEHLEERQLDEGLVTRAVRGLGRGAFNLATRPIKNAVTDWQTDRQARKDTDRARKRAAKQARNKTEEQLKAEDPTRAVDVIDTAYNALNTISFPDRNSNIARAIQRLTRNYSVEGMMAVSGDSKKKKGNEAAGLADELVKQVRRNAGTLSPQDRKILQQAFPAVQALPTALETVAQGDARVRQGRRGRGTQTSQPTTPALPAGEGASEAQQLVSLISQNPNANEVFGEILVALQKRNPKAFDIIRQQYQ